MNISSGIITFYGHMKSLAALCLLLFVFSGCSKLLLNSASGPSVDELAVEGAPWVNSKDVELIFNEPTGTPESYCLKESSIDPLDCQWQPLPIPKNYEFQSQGMVYLSLWLRTSSGKISKPVKTATLLVDYTAPVWNTTTIIHNASHSSLTNSPAATFFATATDNYELSHYEYAIGSGTTSDALQSNVRNWTRVTNASASLTATGLSLVSGNTYYLSLRAVDLAGNVSTSHSSTGWVAIVGTPNPSFVSITPAAPSTNLSPVITGSVSSLVDEVRLYSNSSCTTPLGASFDRSTWLAGVTVSGLTANTVNTIYAQSTFNSVKGLCTLMTTYTHDSVSPTVQRVYSSSSNGAYRAGGTIEVVVRFNEPITVVGTPQLELETGTSNATLNFFQLIGNQGLLFSYTVQTGHQASPLDYASVSALSLNSGTIRDAAGNNATLTLPTPGTPQSLSGQSSLIVDGIIPIAPSIALSSPTTSPGSDNTPTFAISAQDSSAYDVDDVIELFAQANCQGSSVASKTGDELTTILMDAPAQAQGTTSYSVRVSDVAGNQVCSSANATSLLRSVAYLLDTTPPVAPSIALNIPAASPGTVATPTFSIALTGGASFESGDRIDIYNLASCAGSVVGTRTGVTGTSTTITVGTQSAGSVVHSVRVTDAAGLSACSSTFANFSLRTATYLYDNTAPTWADSIVGAGNSSSLTQSPTFVFSANASDGTEGSGIKNYEYAIGTTSGAANLRSWTVLSGNASPTASIQVNGLTLVQGNTYFFSMRVRDRVELVSTTHSKGWIVADLPTLSYAGATGTEGTLGVAMTITPTTLENNGSAITGCAIKAATPALPAWATLDTSTCVISGTPDAGLVPTTFTIVATNGNGSSSDATVSLTVRPSAPTTIARFVPTAAVSNDSTPTFKITGTHVSSAREVKIYRNSSCTTFAGQANENGSLEAEVTSDTLAEGSYLFYATVTDNGAESACSSTAAAYTYDNTAPAVPAIFLTTPSSSPGTVSTPAFTIGLQDSVNFSATDRIDLFNLAACAGTVVATRTSVSGALTLLTASAQGQGTTTYSVRVTDEAGNASCSSAHPTEAVQAVAYLFDNIAPAAPAIALSVPATTPNIVNTPTFAITLQGGDSFESADTIRIYNQAACAGSVVATASGASGLSQLITVSAQPEGTTTYSARITDQVGLTTCSSTNGTVGDRSAVYAYDNTPPAAPSIVLLTSNPGQSSTPNFSIALQGGAAFESNFRIQLFNKAACAGSEVASVTGLSSVDTTMTPTAQDEGSTTYSVRVTDSAGHTRCSSANSTVGLRSATYVYDGTPPAAPSIVRNRPTSTPGNTNTPWFTIELEDGSSFAATDTIIIYKTANCTGQTAGTFTNRTGTSTNAIITSVQVPGTTTYSVLVRDEAYNQTCSSAHNNAALRTSTYEYDNTFPALPLFTLTTPSSSPGNIATPEFTLTLTGGGNFDPTDHISIYTTGGCSASGATVATRTGVSGSSTTLTVDAQSTGTTTYYARVTDAAGNTSCSSANPTAGLRQINYNYDNTPPAVPAIVLTTPSSSPNTINAPIFTASVEGGGNFNANDTLRLYTQAGCTGSVAASKTSVNSATTTLTASAQSEGNQTYSLQVRDPAGNSTCSSANATVGLRSAAYHYDNTAPTWSNTLAGAGNSSSLNSSPEFAFTASADDGINGSGILRYEYSFGTSSGGEQLVSWTTITGGAVPSSLVFHATGLTLTLGQTYYVNIRAIDPVNLVSDVYSKSWLVADLPTLSYAGAMGVDTIISSASVSGVYIAPTTLEANGSPITGCEIKSSTTPLPAWASLDVNSCVISGTPTLPMAPTTFTIFTSNANGSSSDAQVTITIRPEAPTNLVRQSPTGTLGNDQTPTIRVDGGSVAETLSVSLYRNSSCTQHVGTATAGIGDYADVTTSSLGEGSYLFYATVTQNGATSLCSVLAVPYTIDLTPPAKPGLALLSPATSPGTVASPSFTITLDGGVNFQATEIITLRNMVDCLGTDVGTATNISVASAPITANTPQNEGTTSYSVQLTDEAGNSTCSQASVRAIARFVSYELDTTAPTIASNALLGPNYYVSTSQIPLFTFGSFASDSGSGVSRYEYSIGTGLGLSDLRSWTSIATPGSGFQSTGFTLTTGNLYYANVRVIDLVGNISDPISKSWRVAQAPSLAYINARAPMGSPVTISPITLTANGTAITGCAIKASTTPLPAWASLNTTNCTITGTPNARSLASYQIVATNAAGSSSTAMITINIYETLPGNHTITLNNGAAYTNEIPVYVTASSASATHMAFASDANCVNSLAWKTFSSYTEYLPNNFFSGPHQVYVKFQSADGRESPCVSDSIYYGNDLSDNAPAPTFSHFDAGFAGATLTPRVIGSVSEPSLETHVSLYGDNECKNFLVRGTSTAFSGSGIMLPSMIIGTQRTVYARSETVAGELSECGYLNTYTNTTTSSSNSWQAMNADPQSPTTRVQSAGVWTGQEFIVWGGSNEVVTTATNNAGYRYNPKTKVWRSISTTNAPTPRRGHVAVWTGSKMIIWSGSSGTSTYLQNGGIYDPATDTWTTMATANSPAGRFIPTVTWTGSKMIVWGGSPVTNAGGIYDPSTNTWATMTTTGAPTARFGATGIWTGSKLIIWGGDGAGATGGIYDPATDSWTTPSSTGAPTTRYYHSAVWTGSKMVVWGGTSSGSSFMASGGIYDPATDTWTATNTSGAPTNAAYPRAFWYEDRMVVIGNSTTSLSQNFGVYYPATNSWATLNANPLSGSRDLQTVAVLAGSTVLLWGGRAGTRGELGVDHYDIPTDTMTRHGQTSYAHKFASSQSFWTGTEMILWHGQMGGYRYNAANDTWKRLSEVGAPSLRTNAAVTLAGNKLIVWGGIHQSTYLNDGAVYDLSTDTWSTVSSTNAPTARYGASAVWDGTRAIIWGGHNGTTVVNTGGLYNPNTNTWTATPTTTGVAAARMSHTATWTGTYMIVWGGANAAGTALGTGSMYNPNTNSWTAVTGTSAATARFAHTALWTNSTIDRLMIWGGANASYTLSTAHKGYKPTSGWLATVATAAPSNRAGHSAVWTGTHMIIWGGTDYNSNVFATGGIYNATSNTWVSTASTNAPEGRTGHAAVWTGNEMIIWGGHNDSENSTGGRFTP